MSNITITSHHVRSRSERESFWRDHLAAFADSGQSVSAFCETRGLKTTTFYARRLKLFPCDRQGAAGAAPTPGRLRSTGPAFVPVAVASLAGGVDERIEVQLRGGRVLRLAASIPATRLAEVLHALEGQP
jgi:hypothetical protein